MKRRHIAIFSLPTHGHMYPVFGICPELAKRGFRVSYVSTKEYERGILAASAEPIPIEIPAPSSELMEKMKRVFVLPTNDPAWWMMYATVIYPALLQMAVATLSQVERFFREDPPELILYDRLAFAGRILATRFGVPAIQMYPHFAFYKKFMYRENGVCLNPEPMLEFSKVLDTFLGANGIEGKDHLWHTEKLNIYFLPKELQYHADYFDERSCFVGACLRSAPPAAEWPARSNGRPIILVSDVSAGSDAGYFNKFIDALSGRDYHVVLSIGAHIDAASIATLPPNFEINKHTSHLQILPHAALAINHAGILTVLESFYHGVPIVAVPPTPVTEEVAYRLAELGLGVHLRRDLLTADTIRYTVERVLQEDTSIPHEVSRMNHAQRNAGGAQMAADRIERFLGIG